MTMTTKDKIDEITEKIESRYPKWRKRCIQCKYLGLNTPEGILCKVSQKRLGSNYELRFIPANKPGGFRCTQFEQYKNPLEED